MSQHTEKAIMYLVYARAAIAKEAAGSDSPLLDKILTELNLVETLIMQHQRETTK